MDMICASGGIVNILHPRQGILDVKEAGFENVLFDLSAFCSPWELENGGKEEVYCRAKSLSDQYKEAGLRTPIARAPFLKADTKRRDLNKHMFCLACASIRACRDAGCEAVIISPLFSGLDREKERKVNMEYYQNLLPLAKEYHVQILLKNLCRDVGGHLVHGICADAYEAVSWIDRLNEEAGEERFGFCMDTGVCSLCGQRMQEYAHILGNRMKAVILRDNDGHKELSALPFTCTSCGGQCQTDWLGLIRGLREIRFDGSLILDFSDTAASFSPLLRQPLLKLAEAVGEYFVWQIGMEDFLKKCQSIVLFGAGNMCRNYMKCYGETYPPLFTCDNNQKLWGADFCGLKVLPPEQLKEIPEECVILICNIYYREIEQQLRGMGIRNQIGFFNDEYMPSFYFDRLERR